VKVLTKSFMAGVWLVFRILTVARQPGILTRFPFNHSSALLNYEP
jgi:hypothetical protein